MPPQASFVGTGRWLLSLLAGSLLGQPTSGCSGLSWDHQAGGVLGVSVCLLALGDKIIKIRISLLASALVLRMLPYNSGNVPGPSRRPGSQCTAARRLLRGGPFLWPRLDQCLQRLIFHVSGCQNHWGSCPTAPSWALFSKGWFNRSGEKPGIYSFNKLPGWFLLRGSGF